MSDETLPKPDGILSGLPPSKPAPSLSRDAIHEGAPPPAIEVSTTVGEVETQLFRQGTTASLVAVLSAGLLALWNVVALATLTVGRGPLPHTVHERFLVLWLVLGVVWLVVFISAMIQWNSFRILVSLVTLFACVFAWLMNLAGWVLCILVV